MNTYGKLEKHVTKYYLTVDCNVCFQPALRIVVCGGDERHKLVYCTECFSLYNQPNLETMYPYIASKAKLKCPKCGINLASGETHKTLQWATEQEIIDHGWGEFIFYPDQFT